VDFQVLAESDDWIAVAKPAPLIVHPTDKKGQPTLLCGLEQLLAYDLANGAKLSIINRLDRETSGVVMVAKNKSTARAMSRCMERRKVEKVYLAIVFGHPEWDDIVVNDPILSQREVKESAIWLKQLAHEAGKPCSTRFEVLGRYQDEGGRKVSLLRVYPKTGRMHQIRVHAQILGFELIGDKIYGPDENWYLRHIDEGWSSDMELALWMNRQALHAESLNFELDEGSIRVTAPLAADMQQFLDRFDEVVC